jgi:hypothetical protein
MLLIRDISIVGDLMPFLKSLRHADRRRVQGIRFKVYGIRQFKTFYPNLPSETKNTPPFRGRLGLRAEALRRTSGRGS